MKSFKLVLMSTISVILVSSLASANQNLSEAKAKPAKKDGPAVDGGSFLYQEEYMTTMKAVSELIRMVDANPKAVADIIEKLGGTSDLERFKNALRNVSSAPMREVVSKNITGEDEEKLMDYNPTKNSIILLKPFFANFKLLTAKLEGDEGVPHNLLKTLSHEASHAVGLGLTPETNLSQSVTFSDWVFRNYLKLRNDILCGQNGTPEQRNKQCQWQYKKYDGFGYLSKDLLIGLERSKSIIPKVDSTEYNFIYKSASTTYSFSQFTSGAPISSAMVLQACETKRELFNLPGKARLAKINEVEEIFAAMTNGEKHKDRLIHVAENENAVSGGANYQVVPIKYTRESYWSYKYRPSYYNMICIFE